MGSTTKPQTFKDAEKAISDLFTDKSVPRSRTFELLDELVEQIETYQETLEPGEEGDEE